MTPRKPSFMDTQKPVNSTPSKKTKKKKPQVVQPLQKKTVAKVKMPSEFQLRNNPDYMFNKDNVPLIHLNKDMQAQIIRTADPQAKSSLRQTCHYFNLLTNELIRNNETLVAPFFKPHFINRNYVNQLMENRKPSDYQLLFIVEHSDNIRKTVEKWQGNTRTIPVECHGTLFYRLESKSGFLPSLNASGSCISILILPNALFTKTTDFSSLDNHYTLASDYTRYERGPKVAIGDRHFSIDNKYRLATCLITNKNEITYSINQQRDEKIDAVMTGSKDISVTSFMPYYVDLLNKRFFSKEKSLSLRL